MGRTVYIVRGSEDGICGVYGSPVRALRAAECYAYGLALDVTADPVAAEGASMDVYSGFCASTDFDVPVTAAARRRVRAALRSGGRMQVDARGVFATVNAEALR